MKTILLTAVTLISMLVTAQAGTYTYMCKVGSKSYPVTVTTPSNDDLEGGTVTWRGRVFQDVKLGEGCRYNFLATAKDGTTARSRSPRDDCRLCRTVLAATNKCLAQISSGKI